MTSIETNLTVSIATRRPSAWLRNLAIAAIDGLSAAMMAAQDWQERARQRRQLLALPDAALKDFGASRADASGEGNKRFWRV
jgi:uncharacterized protein YjiS (DUF1127 family)